MDEHTLQHGTLQKSHTPGKQKQLIPLSFSQHRMWIIDLIKEHNDHRYNRLSAIELTGNLNIEALQQALLTIVKRHESFRTTYHCEGDKVQQYVHESMPTQVLIHTMAKHELDTKIKQEINTCFKLSEGPLVRFNIVRLEPTLHVLLLNIHHIVSDVVSDEIFVHELNLLYTAYNNKAKCNTLIPLKHQYRDFVEWQQKIQHHNTYKQQLNFWRQQLLGSTGEITLPTDLSQPNKPSYQGKHYHFTFSSTLRKRIQQSCQTYKVSKFTLLLTVFSILLSRYCRQHDFCIGSPVANRQHPDFNEVIGFFANTIVLRCRVNSRDTFVELLQQIKSVCDQAHKNQDVPFEKVVEAVAPERIGSHSPLFQVMFFIQSSMANTINLPGITTAAIPLETNTTKYNLSLILTETDNGISGGQIEYSTQLLKKSTIIAMAHHYQVLIESCLNDVDQYLFNISMMRNNDIKQLLLTGNNTCPQDPQQLCIHTIFESMAEKKTDATALIFGQEQLSYLDLNKNANRLAHYLLAQGVKQGSHVGVMLSRSLQMITSILAVLKSGACYVPIDPTYPTQRIRFLLDNSKTEVILTEQQFAGSIDITGIHTIVNLDTNTSTINKFSTVNPNLSSHSLSLAYINYTSGSTGQPKGVAVTHQAVNRLVINNKFLPDLHTRTTLQISTISFDAATFEIWGALLNGGTCALYPNKLPTPDQLKAAIERYNIDTVFLTSALFNIIIDEKPDALETVRSVLTGGETLSRKHVSSAMKKLPSTHIIHCYGPTENTTFSTFHPITDGDVKKPRRIPIGLPVSHSTAYILDDDHNLLPADVVGELYVGGSGLARGYLGNAKLTAEKFIPHPYPSIPGERLYQTGDLARRYGDDKIDYVSRKDHQVKVRGYRIEPGEITSAILEQPEVATAVVTTNKHKTTTSLIAYVVLKDVKNDRNNNLDIPVDNKHFESLSLRRALQNRLPEYMIPSKFVFVDNITLTSNGKIDYDRLESQRDSHNTSQYYIAPRTKTQATLCEIWQKTLKSNKIGIRDNFFACGGDSILSLQVVSQAKSKGIKINSNDIFTHQNIETIAHNINAEIDLIPYVIPEGELPLLPIQRWFFGSNSAEHHHFNQFRLLTVPDNFSTEFLKDAITAIYKHHDALRLSFNRAGNRWSSRFLETNIAPVDNIVDEVAIPEQKQQRENLIAQYGQTTQFSLNISQGPLIRAVHFKAPTPEHSRLLLVIHHLVVDGVSWRTLIDDLANAYHQWYAGETVLLTNHSNSLKQWLDALYQYSASAPLQKQIAFWLKQLATHQELPGRVRKIDTNDYNFVNSVGFTLTKSETQSLITRCQSVTNSTINDLLLTALAIAFEQWTRKCQLSLKLESHGRETINNQIDINRTVGWFTTLFPLTLHWKKRSNINETLLSVKEQLEAIPNKGFGYGVLYYLRNNQALKMANAKAAPNIVFNYLGQFDQQEGNESIFSRAYELVGERFSQKIFRDHALGFTGEITAERLNFILDYDAREFDPKKIDEIKNLFHNALKNVIEHYFDRSPHPSDCFPLATVDRSTTEKWRDRYKTVEDIYPATKVQLGLIYHSLHNLAQIDALTSPSQHPSNTYATQFYMTLSGNFVQQHFVQAWQKIASRHSVFRTAFVGLSLKQPQQVVVKDLELPWIINDWREKTDDEFELAFEQFRVRDKYRGFEYDQPGLMRFSLFQHNEHEWRFLWTHHHSLLDGWSIPIILGEIQQYYRHYLAGETLKLRPATPYRNYIAWLSKQDSKYSKQYWTNELKNINTTATPPNTTEPAKLETKEQKLCLSDTLTQQLKRMAKKHRVTLNTLFQAAWAYTLHCIDPINSSTVIFGETISGRGAELSGIEDIVGLVINTLPVKIGIDYDKYITQWLQEIQITHTERERHGHLPLADIVQCGGITVGNTLFRSIIAFQIPPSPTQDRSERPLIRFNNIVCEEQTHYDLTLLITLEEHTAKSNITLTLKYAEQSQTDDNTNDTLDYLEKILGALVCPSSTSIADLPLLSLPALPDKNQPSNGVQQKTPIKQAKTHSSKQPSHLITKYKSNVIDIWADTLCLKPDDITDHDNFFVLGGHSLTAIQVVSRLNEVFPVNVTVEDIFSYPTVFQMADYLSRLMSVRHILDDNKNEDYTLEETGAL